MAHENVLAAVEGFLAETGMGASYFGQKAVANSKLVSRLRVGRPIETSTAEKVVDFIASERRRRREEAMRVLTAVEPARQSA